MYAQNLPPSRKLGVWEISPIFPAYGDGLPSSLRLGSSDEEKKWGGVAIYRKNWPLWWTGGDAIGSPLGLTGQ